MSTNDRPSVPYSSRVQTGPQPSLSGAMEAATGFTAQDILDLLSKATEAAIIRTRQDDKLRVDTSVGLIDSKIDGALTQVAKKTSSQELKWKFLFYVAISAAGAMGTVMASCRNAYETARVDAHEPAARAEVKAGEAVAKVVVVERSMEDRMAASDARHAKTEETLAKLGDALDANTLAVLGIAARLDESKKKGK